MLQDRLALAIPLALMLSIDDAIGQTTLRSICGPGYDSGPRGIGDADGDGIGEIAVLESQVRVFSGRTGIQLFVAGVLHAASSEAAPAGDVDGDGRADLLVRSVDCCSSRGWTHVYSGRDWSLIRAWGRCDAGAALGDIDGDGFDDIALSEGGLGTVWSGRNGSALYSVPGTTGIAMSSVGDVDADGTPDFAVPLARGGSTGIVTVLSGADGRLLHWLSGWQAGEGFGSRIAACGDWNLDGHDDFAICAPRRTTNTSGDGAIEVFSGADGAILHRFVGDGLRSMSLRHAGDIDADGFADLIVVGGYPAAFEILSGPNGTRRAFSMSGTVGYGVDGAGDLDLDGYDDVLVTSLSCLYFVGIDPISARQPGRAWIFGTACPGLADRMPRIDYAGRADLGATLHMSLRGARPNTGCVLHIGTPSAIALDLVGMPGCSLYAVPLLTAGAGTDAVGAARSALAIPIDLAPLGYRLNFQWAIWDPGVNPLGVTLSDGVGTALGQPPP